MKKIFYQIIKKTFAAIIILGGLLITGCEKILEVPKPPNEILLENAFRDSIGASGAVLGIYSQMITHYNFEWGGIVNNLSRSADDLKKNTPDDFELNTLTPLTSGVNSMWTTAYQSVLHINSAIEGLKTADGISLKLKNQLLGECYFDRAFVYFNLVNIWGDATALSLSPTLEANSSAASVPSATVYEQIIIDLKQAQDLLANNYPSTAKGRPSAAAATALLSRVYLYLGRNEDAIVQASVLISGGTYGPLPAPESAFLKTSKETIWTLDPASNSSIYLGAVPDGYNYVPTNTFFAPTYTLTPQLLASFETGDRRKAQWVRTAVVGVNTINSPYKYKANGITVPSGTESYTVLRLAEQYLIRAEAYTRTNNVPSAVADLNVVRTRAGLTGLSAGLSQAACMSAVEQERRVELFAEWGHRWFDLNRWPATDGSNLKRSDQVLSLIKSSWKPFQKVFPLPLNEPTYDPNLKQNPGY